MEKSFQIQVLERLTAIETTLKNQDYRVINETLNKTENRSKNNEDRLNKIEDNTRWLWRTLAGILITSAIYIIFSLK